jgi:Lipocalin-like domain
MSRPFAEREERGAMRKNALAGAWALRSFEIRTSDGKASFPYGQDALGYLLYLPDGYMSVAFMSQARPAFPADDALGGTTEERGRAFATFLAYCGRYEVHTDRVVHHVEVSLFPNWTGQDQIRFYRLEGDLLILTSPPLVLKGVEQTLHLVLKKSR